MSDFIALQEEGEITSSASAYCHSLSITEDDLVESPEDLLVNLHPVFNVAQVELAPSNTTVTIRDTDGMSLMKILSLVIRISGTNHFFAQVSFN